MYESERKLQYRCALTLFVLAPLISEVLSGATPLTRWSALVPVVLLYGGGVTLIRELRRRLRLGAGAIVLLGAAYALMEEALVLQSTFSPTLFGAGGMGGRALAVNWIWTEWVVGYHIVWSVAIPIFLAEVLFPAERLTPWLGRAGMAFAGVCFTAGALSMGTYFRRNITAGFHASAINAISTATLICILIGLALKQPSSTSPAPMTDAHSLWSFGAAGFFASAAWYGLLNLPDRLRHGPLVLLPMLAGVVLATAAIKALVNRERSDRESLALVCGALLTIELNGLLGMRTDQHGDRIPYGIAALCSLALTGLLLRHLGFRQRKSLAQQAVVASRASALTLNTRAASARKPVRVLIIGGGVAGPALALFLKKAGVSSSIFEAYPFREGVGGGLGLAPNGMKVLRSLGVAEEIKREGTVIRRFAFNNGSGRKLTSYELNHDRYGEPMVALDRATLFELLADQMSHKGIDVHYGKKLTHVEEMGSSIAAHFEDGSSVEGDLIIGADGVRSAVRTYVVPESQAEYTGLVGVGGFTSLSSLPSLGSQILDTMTFTFGKNGFVGYSGCHQGTMMWWSNLFREREYSGEELSQLNPSAIIDEMLDRFGEYADPIPSLIQHSKNLLRINVYDILSLPTWHKGRALLLGDAAHTVSPNAGQGASMALEDSMYLAKLLRNSQDPLVFRAFEWARKERAERIVAEGRRRGKDKAVVGPIEQTIREWMIRTIGLFGKNADDWIFRYTIKWD